IKTVEESGCHILFLPSVDEMYPQGMQLNHQYNLGELETLWEGKYRPGHFKGVCQIVERLLDIIEPNFLFLGQKDYQQVMVIKTVEESGCHILFLPSVDEMYPQGMQLNHQYNLGELETLWEGKYRPGHFKGVCQIVERLLDIIEPNFLFLGQKDYQQVMVIK